MAASNQQNGINQDEINAILWKACDTFPDFVSLCGYYVEFGKRHWSDYVSGFTVLGISDDRS